MLCSISSPDDAMLTAFTVWEKFCCNSICSPFTSAIKCASVLTYLHLHANYLKKITFLKGRAELTENRSVTFFRVFLVYFIVEQLLWSQNCC